MSSIFVGRVVTFGCLLVLAMVVVAQAAGTGAEIAEFTQGTQRLFEAMRAVSFVRGTGVTLFALLLVAGFGGFISGGWVTVIGGLLILGAWFGAEPIVDTIFGAGVVF